MPRIAHRLMSVLVIAALIGSRQDALFDRTDAHTPLLYESVFSANFQNQAIVPAPGNYVDPIIDPAKQYELDHRPFAASAEPTTQAEFTHLEAVLPELGIELAPKIPVATRQYWEGLVKQATPAVRTIRDFPIHAYFIVDKEHRMPPGLPGYSFRYRGRLVIVTHDPVVPGSAAEEAAFREGKKYVWEKALIAENQKRPSPRKFRLDEIRRRAHILASGEYVSTFGTEGLTRHHQLKFSLMSLRQWRNRIREERSDSYFILHRYLGPSKLKLVQQYDDRFDAYVKRLIQADTKEELDRQCETGRSVVLQTWDGRAISGTLRHSGGSEYVIENPRFEDETFEIKGNAVHLPLAEIAEVVHGLSGTTDIESFLLTLPPEDAKSLRGAYFSRQTNYVEQMHGLKQKAQELLNRLEAELDLETGTPSEQARQAVRLCQIILNATSHKEVLKALGAVHIVDREYEVIVILRNLLKARDEIHADNQAPSQNVTKLIQDLLAAEERVRWLRNFSLRVADGIVRTRDYITPPEKLGTLLEEKFGASKLADLLVIGAGPSGISVALHALALGQKVIMIDPRTLQSFSDAFMQAVHWMRTNALENSLVRDSFPALMEMFGLDRHLPLYRLLGDVARAQCCTVTGNAMRGLPKDSDQLTGLAALSAPNARNEILLHFAHVLDYVASQGVVFGDVMTAAYEEVDGLYRVTLRDGNQLLVRDLHLATGMVGPHAEFARQSRFLNELPGHFVVFNDATDFDVPAKGKDLLQIIRQIKEGRAPGQQIILSDPLLGSPDITELFRVLAAKSVPVTVAVIGDGESAVKAAVEACNAGPHIHVELFIKKQLHGARLHIPGEQLKREQIAMTAIDAERMKRSLAEAAAYPHSVTLQTLKDVEQLEAAGRLRKHCFNDHYFDETTVEMVQELQADGSLKTKIYTKLDAAGRVVINQVKEGKPASSSEKDGLDLTAYSKESDGRYLLAVVDGPLITAIGYNTKALSENPEVQLMEKSGIVPHDAAPVASDRYLTIGFEGKPNNPSFSGPAINARMAPDLAIPSHAARAILNALRRLERDFNQWLKLTDHIRPFASAAFRVRDEDHNFTETEHLLHVQIMQIIHDPEFGRVMGTEAMPWMVYRPKAPVLAVLNGSPEMIVPLRPESDPTRVAFIDDALRGESNLELIPHLVATLQNPGAFAEEVRNRALRAETVSDNFIQKINSLKSFVQEHPDIRLGDLVSHAGWRRTVIYMDPLDYEALFATRSERRINFAVHAGAEYKRGQPLIVQVLQHAFAHQISQDIVDERRINELAPVEVETVDFLRGLRRTHGILLPPLLTQSS